MCSVGFDIETGPLPLEVLKSIIRPFDKSTFKHPGEFDPSSVKYGNTKDEDKRAAKLEEARQKHAEALANYVSDLAKAENNYWSETLDRAALSALTGTVLAIGYNGKKAVVDHGRSEVELITNFWTKFVDCRKSDRKMYGFNIRRFDVPFLIKRSIILAIDFPESVFEGRYLSSTFVDLNDIWMAGSSGYDGNLDEIARACGVGQKPEGCNGGRFAVLYNNPDTRQQAIEYALNDLDMARGISARVGL